MSNNLDSKLTNLQDAKDLGLTEKEFEKIIFILGRIPTYCELGIYSVMWSEHCSYKNSISQLKTLLEKEKNYLLKLVKKMLVW